MTATTSKRSRSRRTKSGSIEGTVAIVGVTGQVGSRVAARLSNQKVKVRGIARHPHDYTGKGRLELFEADCRNLDEARNAIEGASAVYLTPPLGDKHPLADQRKVTSNIIRAAREQAVQHLVMHTALHAKQANTGAQVIDAKQPIEQELKDSGVPFTILRPGWFLDNLMAEKDVIAGGSILMPIPPERRIGVVAARDVAKAAVGILHAGPQNRGFDLHVGGGANGPELAQAATKALGQPVVYREAPFDDFVEHAAVGDRHRQLQSELYGFLREQDFLGEPETIREALPNFRYTSVDRFMERKIAPAAAATAEEIVLTPWLPTPNEMGPLAPGDGPFSPPEPPGHRLGE